MVYTHLFAPGSERESPEYQGLPPARCQGIRFPPLNQSLLARENPLKLTTLPNRPPEFTAQDLETASVVEGTVFVLIEIQAFQVIWFTTSFGAVQGLWRPATP